MKAVKPYCVSGYKNRLFDGIRRSIKRIRISYKILPFLPVVLFIAYPFFNRNFYTPIINHLLEWLPSWSLLILLPPTENLSLLAPLPIWIIILFSMIWWSYCITNFEFIAYHFITYPFIPDYIFEHDFDREVSYLIYFIAIPFFVLISMALISILLLYLIPNKIVIFYITTLPILSGLSYVNLGALEKKRSKQT